MRDSTVDRGDRGRRGQSLVELTLLIPVLLWICAGIVDFGRVYYYNIAAVSAARAGARVAVNTIKDDNAVIAAAQADAANSFPASANLTITVSPSPTRSTGDTVTVTVQYTFAPMTPLIAGLFSGGQLTTARTAMMVAF